MTVNSLLRIRLLYVLIIVFAFLFIYRLFSLQIVNAGYYLAQADRQYGNDSLTKRRERGTIFFSDKSGALVPVAAMRDGFTLVIKPTELKDPLKAYAAVNEIVVIDFADFITRAGKAGDPHEEIMNRLEPEVGAKIAALKIPGVVAEKDRWRFYPLGELASHVLGFFAYDDNGTKLVGRYGLEKYYENLLKRNPEQSFASFLTKTFSEIGTAISYSGGEREADLILTIESGVQSSVEEELKQVKEGRQAEAAGAIVMDPQTGALLAMAALPNFDPNARQNDLSLLDNPLIESVFEMGSVVKPLTLAAALDAKVLTPETTYYDKGFVILNDKEIKNFDGKGRGQVNMQEVLNQSLNTGAVFVIQQLGRERFRQYFLNFGLGEKTGVDLPGEVAGLVKNLQSRQEVDYASASFGQGIAVTPLGLTRALAALANGGNLVRPHVVKSFRWRNSLLTTDVKPEVGRRVLSPEASAEMTRMLTEVVDTALVGGKVKLANYRIAAKTGTAQMPAASGGGYDPDRFLHAFFGYLPATSPRFLVFLYLVNPQDVRFASETLTTPFMNIAKFLLNYYDVPPDRLEAANAQKTD